MEKGTKRKVVKIYVVDAEKNEEFEIKKFSGYTQILKETPQLCQWGVWNKTTKTWRFHCSRLIPIMEAICQFHNVWLIRDSTPHSNINHEPGRSISTPNMGSSFNVTTESKLIKIDDGHTEQHRTETGITKGMDTKLIPTNEDSPLVFHNRTLNAKSDEVIEKEITKMDTAIEQDQESTCVELKNEKDGAKEEDRVLPFYLTPSTLGDTATMNSSECPKTSELIPPSPEPKPEPHFENIIDLSVDEEASNDLPEIIDCTEQEVIREGENQTSDLGDQKKDSGKNMITFSQYEASAASLLSTTADTSKHSSSPVEGRHALKLARNTIIDMGMETASPPVISLDDTKHDHTHGGGEDEAQSLLISPEVVCNKDNLEQKRAIPNDGRLKTLRSEHGSYPPTAAISEPKPQIVPPPSSPRIIKSPGNNGKFKPRLETYCRVGKLPDRCPKSRSCKSCKSCDAHCFCAEIQKANESHRQEQDSLLQQARERLVRKKRLDKQYSNPHHSVEDWTAEMIISRSNHHISPRVVLGVSTHASMDEIKHRFRRFALKFHPDKCPKDEIEKSVDAFIILKSAYNQLLSSECPTMI